MSFRPGQLFDGKAVLRVGIKAGTDEDNLPAWAVMIAGAA